MNITRLGGEEVFGYLLSRARLSLARCFCVCLCLCLLILKRVFSSTVSPVCTQDRGLHQPADSVWSVSLVCWLPLMNWHNANTNITKKT